MRKRIPFQMVSRHALHHRRWQLCVLPWPNKQPTTHKAWQQTLLWPIDSIPNPVQVKETKHCETTRTVVIIKSPDYAVDILSHPPFTRPASASRECWSKQSISYNNWTSIQVLCLFLSSFFCQSSDEHIVGVVYVCFNQAASTDQCLSWYFITGWIISCSQYHWWVSLVYSFERDDQLELNTSIALPGLLAPRVITFHHYCWSLYPMWSSKMRVIIARASLAPRANHAVLSSSIKWIVSTICMCSYWRAR
jgi:hypothetical protein